MERLTRHKPENNTQTMLNFAYARDGHVKLAYAGCTENADLCEYIADKAADAGYSCAPTPDEVMEGSCMECDCVFGILANVATQAAELHARLMKIEDILGDDYNLDCLRDLMGSHAMAICELAMVPKWIPVTDRLPVNETRVLVLSECRYDGKVFYNVTIGMHEDGTVWRADSDWFWETDNWDTYDEERDDWKVPEGWFEYAIYNEDGMQSAIDDFVTHWMPLPDKEDA